MVTFLHLSLSVLFFIALLSDYRFVAASTIILLSLLSVFVEVSFLLLFHYWLGPREAFWITAADFCCHCYLRFCFFALLILNLGTQYSGNEKLHYAVQKIQKNQALELTLLYITTSFTKLLFLM